MCSILPENKHCIILKRHTCPFYCVRVDNNTEYAKKITVGVKLETTSFNLFQITLIT